MLSIKGPAANYYGLRRDRVSADTDILVDPVDHQRYCELLEQYGWRPYFGRETPSLLPWHARTYTHPSWPCAIDVHRYFPGFFAEPQDVFDELWKGRSVLEVANTKILIPSLPTSAVIAALHAARHPDSPRHVEEEAQVVDRLLFHFSDQERRDFYATASSGGAIWVLRHVIARGELGPTIADASVDQMTRWSYQRTYGQESGAVGWLVELQHSRWLPRVQIALRALWVPRRHVPRSDPMRSPSHREAIAYNAARLQRGAAVAVRFAFRKRR